MFLTFFFLEAAVFGASQHPPTSGQEVLPPYRTSEAYNGQGTGETGWVLVLTGSSQVGLLTFLIRNVTNVYHCLIIWEVCYLFLRYAELEFAVSAYDKR